MLNHKKIVGGVIGYVNVVACRGGYTTSRYYSFANNRTKQQLYAFGSNENLKLGVPGIEDRNVPTQITNLDPFINIKSFGSSWLHSYLLSKDETNDSTKVYMWGNNRSGNMGLPAESYKYPVLVDILKNIAKISIGRSFSLALTNDGKLLSMGENSFGQLGLGHSLNTPTPTLIQDLASQEIVDISTGLDHCVAVTKSGHVFAWGYNLEGQLGQKIVEYQTTTSTAIPVDEKEAFSNFEPDVEYNTPTLVPGLESIKIAKVFCGFDNTLLLSARGNVYGFGSNDVGSLGLGSELKGRLMKPTKIPMGNEKVQSLSSGPSHTMFVTNQNNVYVCGWGREGRLGLGDNTSDRDTPTLIEYFKENNIKIVKVAAGGSHSLALSQDNQVYSWGNGANGKLGHGNETEQKIPKLIESLKNKKAIDIAAGIDSSFVLVEN
ncbi:hypothetical protein CYY_001635 [Polysphondylium violaceum]|uniref:RCC1-like domain-containing protein n=1 Tax=Polysphondylium violaceum TaxID=133409 RepID=A0A8J4V3Y8_9MYCE|nr:hypothetical protein CYY_001635 [Polysphondylium violaceum]